MKIITVHGTFSKKSTDNTVKQWWENDSDFHEKIKSEFKSDSVETEEFLWSAKNDQLSREEAGKQLFERLKNLQKDGKRFSLISHSHGGQVCYEAFVEAKRNGESLDLLHHWISVGSPFLNIKHSRLLQRIGLLRTFIMMVCVIFLMMIFWIAREQIQSNSDYLNYILPIFLAISIIPLFVIYYVMKVVYKSPLSNIWKKSIANSYRAKSTFYYHPADEAIFALETARSFKFPTQSQSFFRNWLMILSILILFSVTIYFIFQSINNGVEFSQIYSNVLNSPALSLATAGNVPSDSVERGVQGDFSLLTIVFLTILLAIIFYIIFVAVIFYVLGWVLDMIASRIASLVLTRGIRSKIWGTDTGPRAVYAISRTPPYFSTDNYGAVELEERFQKQIEDNCNIALASSSRVLRQVLAQIGLGQATVSDAREVLIQESGLRELIHTSYFENKGFQNTLIKKLKTNIV